MSFKLIDLATDSGQRHAQIPTGSRKASLLDYPQEDRHGFKAVHDYPNK
jgi:hypothetical protein